MSYIKRGSKSVFTGQVTNIGRQLLYPVGIKSYSSVNGLIMGGDTKVFTQLQIDAIQNVRDYYTLVFADGKFENIPTNYDEYITLLNQLNDINVNDQILKLLISIATDTLIGTLNITSIYERSMFDEIKIIQLTNQEDEILKKKNVKSTIGTVAGNFTAKKTMKLSKIYSFYILIYGFPPYGVGFQPDRLAFLKKVQAQFDATQPAI